MAHKLFSIIIKPENIVALTEAVASIRGDSKSEAWASAQDIMYAAVAAETRLEEAGVPVKDRFECTYEFKAAGPSAASYRFKKTVPFFVLFRRRTGWSLNVYSQVEVYPKTPELDRVVLTEAARDAVVAAALKPFGVAA